MGKLTVKRKLPSSTEILARRGAKTSIVLGTLALLTFIFSLLPLPSPFIESWFARAAFPRISSFFAVIADLIPVAWLDILIFGLILYICVCLGRRRWPRLIEIVSVCSLIFFWSWGLNYHPLPLSSKLSLNATARSP